MLLSLSINIFIYIHDNVTQRYSEMITKSNRITDTLTLGHTYTPRYTSHTFHQLEIDNRMLQCFFFLPSRVACLQAFENSPIPVL